MATKHPTTDPKEEKFRKESRWLSFKSTTWGALGAATFFGALMTIAGGLVSLAMGVPAQLENGNLTASAPLLSATGISAMTGLMAFGGLATWMSQRDATELRIVQDEHMAQLQAKCMGTEKGKSNSVSATASIEYPENCRADGKDWGDVVSVKPQLVVSR